MDNSYVLGHIKRLRKSRKQAKDPACRPTLQPVREPVDGYDPETPNIFRHDPASALRPDKYGEASRSGFTKLPEWLEIKNGQVTLSADELASLLDYAQFIGRFIGYTWALFDSSGNSIIHSDDIQSLEERALRFARKDLGAGARHVPRVFPFIISRF